MFGFDPIGALQDFSSTVGKTLSNLFSSGQSAVQGTTQAVGPAVGTFQWYQNQGLASVAPSNYTQKTVIGNDFKNDTSFLNNTVTDFFSGLSKTAQQYISNKVFGTPTIPLDQKVVTTTPTVKVNTVGSAVSPSDFFSRFFNGLIGVTPSNKNESTASAPAPVNYWPMILVAFAGIALILVISGRK